MQKNSLNIVHKPVHDRIYDIVKTGESVPAIIVDASNEHYENRKILRKLMSKIPMRGYINFIATIENISSVLTCIKELDTEEKWGAHITTFSNLDFTQPIFLVRIHYNSSESFQLIPSSARISPKLEHSFGLMADIILHDTMEQDIVLCIGKKSCEKFLDKIKGNCRYFVGIMSGMTDNDIFTNQGVEIVKRV